MDQMVCLMSSTILFYALKAITCLILALFIGYIAFAQKYLIYGDFKLFWFSVRRGEPWSAVEPRGALWSAVERHGAPWNAVERGTPRIYYNLI